MENRLRLAPNKRVQGKWNEVDALSGEPRFAAGAQTCVESFGVGFFFTGAQGRDRFGGKDYNVAWEYVSRSAACFVFWVNQQEEGQGETSPLGLLFLPSLTAAFGDRWACLDLDQAGVVLRCLAFDRRSSAAESCSVLKCLLVFCLISFFASGSAKVSKGKPVLIEDIGLELNYVEAGSFHMGSSSGEPERDTAEGPVTVVLFKRGFWLGETEVTQAQYEAIVGVNPSHFKGAGLHAPVEEVSWDDAMAFCRLLTERERTAKRLSRSYEYTLPTEAQWEYAYRAGTKGSYPGNLASMAWSNGNSRMTTHPVACLKPNDWGFYDMSGNVLEWCLDWYGGYPGGSVVDPQGPKKGYYRIARGGSWRTDSRLGRSAARAGGSQARRDYTIGFRVALVRVQD